MTPEAAVPWQELAQTWILVGLMLAIYSFVYKDNPVFKFAEHLYIGLSVAYIVCFTYFNILVPDVIDPFQRLARGAQLNPGESWWRLVPVALGVLVLFQAAPARVSWLSRWSFAFIVGVGAGISIPIAVQTYLFKQILTTMTDLWVAENGRIDWLATTSAWLILAGVICTLVYFLFSLEHRGVVRSAARTGIYFLMISFGASFGYTVMARESLLIRRINQLYDLAGPKYGYPTLVLLALIAGVIGIWEWRRRRSAPADRP